MTLQEIVDYYRTYEEDLIDIALFKDKSGNILIGLIKNDNITGVSIDVFTLEEEKAAYLDIKPNPNKENRIYLSDIYCYEKFRGLGIASCISGLVDYIMQNYIGYVIYGIYQPSQMSTDRINWVMTEEELNKRATAFYRNAGYTILSYSDYLANQESYPYLNPDIDFINREDPNYKGIFKRILPLPKYDYTKINGLLIHENALDELTELNSSAKRMLKLNQIVQ